MKALCKVQSFKRTSKQVVFFKKINDLKESELGRQSNYSESGNEDLLFIGGHLCIIRC